MSVKFNSDSDKIIVGAKRGKLAVFDMECEKITEFVKAHTEDINSVQWANRDQSNIIYTGSDDCFIKVWDKRTLKFS